MNVENEPLGIALDDPGKAQVAVQQGQPASIQSATAWRDQRTSAPMRKRDGMHPPSARPGVFIRSSRIRHLFGQKIWNPCPLLTAIFDLYSWGDIKKGLPLRSNRDFAVIFQRFGIPFGPNGEFHPTSGTPMSIEAEKRGKGRAKSATTKPASDPKDGNHREKDGSAVAADHERGVPSTADGAAALPEQESALPLKAPAGRGQRPAAVTVHIAVIRGGISKVKAPVAVAARYRGVPLAGPAKASDRLLDSWLTRAIDRGMIGGGLGELFIVPGEAGGDARHIAADNLLLVGAGEPTRFAPDDLRFLIANVTVAVKVLGHNHLSTGLIGARRKEMSAERALRETLQGVLDGYEHLCSILEAGISDKARFQKAFDEPLLISLVEPDESKAAEMYRLLCSIRDTQAIDGLQLEVERGDDVELEPESGPNPMDVDPDEPMTLFRVTTAAGGRVAMPASAGMEVLQFSALGEGSVITVRELEVNSYFVRQLPRRLTSSTSLTDQEDFGVFFGNYLIPEDFRQLIEGAEHQLTLVLDETTAAFPWEMAAFKKHSKTCFLGTDLHLARQFQTLQSPAPGSPPPVNHTLKVLVIADPAPGRLSLPEARVEGLTVVEVLEHARRVWQGQYDIRVTVRLGSYPEKDELEGWLGKLREQMDLVESAEPCDPLELAMLIVNQAFDVIHYAGHGEFNPQAGRAGWIFDEDCVLSAQEILRVRQVPRLVFANACFSSVTDKHDEQRRQLVGLAQAFFARGIQNYIGAGWKVNDALALDCARCFYNGVLGLHPSREGGAPLGTAPPGTIGQALANARLAILGKASSTWGAYQHYGRACDKLLALPNLAKNSK